ncbi:glutamate--tRNA ligase [Bacteroidetes bacterium endosymbiont of Geopemphigus sp.]|uniref:glutamate--tRNA ligase n=1 Tax=Bacteroidetes bacterium endosymbiont of Geopemphigus sp. TaxID=2047937 RepID=UPI001F4E2C15|nr:glutamate--tRNA ligase [Bacteroidetes bacterium endosymbiont of Geopemphigus sp.]
MKKTRVRFAPSPTGPLHLGGLRTALYNYLLAQKYKGDFILRIEDTDQKRFVPGAEEYILKSLNWCGLTPDESPYHGGKYGPYRQSERRSIYKPYFRHLVKEGHAYYAFDTAEMLDKKRKVFESQGNTFSYNAQTRLQMDNSLSLTAQEVTSRLEKGDQYVIRFKTPADNQILEMYDEIRGEIKINTATLDDKVLVKSDGMPTYHLANIVDDHLMEITHVIRGEEWLPSLPLHWLLYEAMGWKMPYFAHLPLILKPEGGGKLSKRDGDRLGFPIFPLQWKDPQSGVLNRGYREVGYFPEAFINMLALLGWNPGGEQEIFSLKELIDLFSLDRVGKSGARFSKEKAQWFNQQYLQKKPLTELIRLFQQELKKYKVNNSTQRYNRKVVESVRDRASFVHDLWEKAYYFFMPPLQYDPKAFKKAWHKESFYILKNLTADLSKWEDFNACILKKHLRDFAATQDLSFGKLIQSLRLALVGDLQGNDIFFIMEMLGQKETIKRIEQLIQRAPQ